MLTGTPVHRKLQVSPNFTLDNVADSNYRGKCDVGGFLIFEWTLVNVALSSLPLSNGWAYVAT
jgi:hypothetical protein